MAARNASSVDVAAVERSDEELVDAMRSGDNGGYAILWARHAAAARRAARAITSSFDPDDLVSEAFASILSAIQGGGGPTGPFRPYLFATIRNISATWARKGKDLSLDDLPEAVFSDTGSDPLDQLSTRTSLATAFRRLPARHRTLLWYLEVEGMKPREIAPLMGLTPNAVSALAYRAREGFRQAWLDIHIADPSRPEDCRWVCERVLIQGDKPLARGDRARYNEHLDTCRACQIVTAGAENVSQRLRVVLLPLLLGGAAAATYIADTTPAVAAAGAVVGGAAVADAGVPVVASGAGQGVDIFSSAAFIAAEPTKHIGVGVGIGATLTAAAAATAVAVLVASATWSPPEVSVAASPVVVSPQAQPLASPSPSVTPPPLPPVVEAVGEGNVPQPSPSATAPPPSPSPSPSPEPAPTVPPVVTSFRLTTDIDVHATVPPVLEGTGIPGAIVAILDENDVVLLETSVGSDGLFAADISGDLLHQSMILRARQTVAGAALPEFTDPIGPFVLPVPSIGGLGPAGILTALDGDGDGEMDDALIELKGIAGSHVAVSWDDGERIAYLAISREPDTLLDIPDEPDVALLTDIALGSHSVVVRYVDEPTGRLGLASPEQGVIVAVPSWSHTEPDAEP